MVECLLTCMRSCSDFLCLVVVRVRVRGVECEFGVSIVLAIFVVTRLLISVCVRVAVSTLRLLRRAWSYW